MTVKTILRNDVYLGHMVQNKTGTLSYKLHKQIAKPKDDWIEMIRNYADLAELDRPTLLRLIRKIKVGEKYEKDGETHRDIKIYYNFVGYVEI